MRVITVPCHFDNYAYIVICDEKKEAIVIDPAEYYPVSSELEKLGVRLSGIYCTHHHADHIGGLEDFCAEHPLVKVYGHASDMTRVNGMNGPLIHGQDVTVGNITGEVLHTPGHTSGSVSYLFKNNLFTGDTLFGAGCGRLFEGSAEQMYESLSLLMKKSSDQTEVYFGHEYTQQNLKFAQFLEPLNSEIEGRINFSATQRNKDRPTGPSTMKLERATNPFLRCTLTSVVAQIKDKLFLETDDPPTVFGAMRRLKDSY
jgi:hydroxyacylglutathione hydrolase